MCAQIYKWVDEHGNVHFGDSPQQNSDAREISQDLPELNMSEGSHSGYSPTSVGADAEIKRQERNEQQAKAAKRKSQCDKARKELKTISGPVYFTREDGTEYTISEAERAQLEQELRAEIERYCG